MSQCAIWGIPLAIVGAIVYFFRKKRNSSESASKKGANS
jgi:hypothetical protein